MTPTCVYINLDRDLDRRAHIEAQCTKAALGFLRFSALKGADLPPWANAYFPPTFHRQSFALSPGEVGCYASHLAICRLIAGGEIKAPTLVLEDDVELPENIGTLLDRLIAMLPADWDMVRLSNESKHVVAPLASLSPVHKLVRYANVPGSTGASLMSLAGARKFAVETPRNLPVDQDLRRVWKWRLNMFGVSPAPIRRDVFDLSSIDGLTSKGWREKRSRVAHLRRRRLLEMPARHIYGLHEFGAARWLLAEAASGAVGLAPKKQRASLLAAVSNWLAPRQERESGRE